MGGGGKGGGGGNQTVKMSPWGPATGYLEDVMQQGQGLYQQGSPGAYPGQMVAPLNPWQLGSAQMQADRAMQGSPLTDMAQQAIGGQVAGVPNPTYDFLGGAMMNPYGGAGMGLPWAEAAAQNAFGMNPAAGLLGQTAGGAYVGANPYLDATYGRAADAMLDQFSEATMPNMSAMFSRAGGTGGSTQALQTGRAQEGLAEGLSDLATGIYGGAYGQERANQLAAQQALGSQWLQGLGAQQGAAQGIGGLGQAGLAGQLGAAGQLGGQFQSDLARQLQASQMAFPAAREDYFDASQLGAAGGLLQGQQQQQLAAEQARWQDAMYGGGSPQQWLGNYANLIYPAAGMGGSQWTDLPGQSAAGGFLSGGLGGLAAGAALGASPWGMAGLGLGGGLLGSIM
jgi:hypothetical protein